MKLSDYLVVALMILASIAFFAAGLVYGQSERMAKEWPSAAFKIESNP